jgi:ABC-2 type transport system ATP-binding protein
VMGFTGLDILASKAIHGLSKGMKQRLCLGRALIHDPQVLVLDEPAAGLDPRARIELRDMIGHLAAGGKTVLISSHILSELAEMCDCIGIIEHGKLLAVGTVEEIRAEHRAQSIVRVGVLSGADQLAQWLSQRDDVEDVQIDGDMITLSHDVDREAEVALLRSMVEAGFPVAEFGSHRKTLEDVFMQVTRGEVQ